MPVAQPRRHHAAAHGSLAWGPVHAQLQGAGLLSCCEGWLSQVLMTLRAPSIKLCWLLQVLACCQVDAVGQYHW